MWNCKDTVLHVKKYLEEKTGVSCQEQILQRSGTGITLVDEHLLFDSNMTDEHVVILSVSQTSSFQIFVKGRNGKNTVLWVKSLDKVNDIKDKIASKHMIPAQEQRLVFNGREMLGDRSMSDYHMRKITRSSWSCASAAAHQRRD